MVDRCSVPRLITGSGRSGTTWVLDCLADANALRPVFEPLHPAESALGHRYAFDIIAPGDVDETLEKYFRELAAGRIRSRWLDYRGRRDRLSPRPAYFMSGRAFKAWLRRWRKYRHNRALLREATQREGVLIKCIRANLMAGWLTRTIGFRTILVIRHPGAVIESQYRLGSVWDPEPVLERYRMSRRLHELTGGRYQELLNSRLTHLQALTLNWIIENQWPVERSATDGYSVIYYEELVSRPEPTWKRLCRCLELAQGPDPMVLHKPSQQSSIEPEEGPARANREIGWRSRLNRQQLDTIQALLDATECDLYHTNKNAPLRASHHSNE